MNLLDLFVKIGVDDQASGQMQGLSTGMIAKAQLMADGVKSAVSSAVSAIQGLVQGSIGAFAQYEQNVGGIETFFGKSADTVIANAKRAYETAGMSANQYMSTTSSFAMSLITSVAKRRQQVVQQDTTAQQKALDSQVSNLERALQQQYNDTQRAYQAQYSERQRALSDETDALRKSLDKQVEARQKALDKEVDAFQRATDKRIKQINREYTERLKLTDEEEYRRLKAIDDQIDGLDAQTEAERLAQKRREQDEKASDLRRQIANAKTIEEREKAQRDLSDLMADIEQEDRERERNAQKDALRDQRDAIRDEYSKKRDAIREQQDLQVEQYKAARDKELAKLRESNEDKIDSLREANERILKEQQRANEIELENMRTTQQAQLDAMKASQDAQLDAMRESVAQQKSELEGAADATGGYIEATAEDQAEAARIADMAMRDMSDNANKMGTDMGSIEMAYQGFAKGNFTMLDNLRLGYGGTSHEAQRLLDDAEALKAKQGEVVDYSLDSFADIVEAIHVIQEENGITGTTADEGATTIEGAMNRAKASWENWLVSVASGNGNIGEDTKTMVDTVADAAALIIPKIGTILSNLVTQVAERAPEIWEQFKTEMMNALPDEWKEKLQGFLDALSGFFELVGSVVTFLSENAETVSNFAMAFGALSVISTVTGAISGLVTTFGPLVSGIAGAVAEFGGLGAVVAKVLSFFAGPAGLVLAIASVVAAIVSFVSQNEEAQKVIETVWTAIKDFFGGIPGAISGFLKSAYDTVTGIFGGIGKFVTDTMGGFAKGVQTGFDTVVKFIGDIPKTVMGFFSNAGDWLFNAGKNILTGFWNGLTSVWNDLTGWISDIGGWIQEHKGPEAYDKALEASGSWADSGEALSPSSRARSCPTCRGWPARCRMLSVARCCRPWSRGSVRRAVRPRGRHRRTSRPYSNLTECSSGGWCSSSTARRRSVLA